MMEVFDSLCLVYNGHFTSDNIHHQNSTTVLNYNTMKQLKERYRRATGDRKIVVDILAILFGVGSWIGINGMFVQLPLLVNTAPEGWSLPSYMSVAVQLANIGPITYAFLRKIFPKLNDAYCIYSLLFLGVVSSVLLIFLYSHTTYVGEQEHSTVFLILVFAIAIVGCTSSVLFYPFMRHFKEQYLITYFVGEGLSGFLPSIVALIQGVGGNPTCVTDPGTNITIPVYKEPLFTPPYFFGFLAVAMTISFISSILLNNLEVCKLEMVSNKNSIMRDDKHELDRRIENDRVEDNISLSVKSDIDLKAISLTRSVTLLLLMALVCAFSNGVFPSVQSYSCLPYGNIAYNLAVKLSSMANPIACFLAMFLPHTSNRAISTLTILCGCLTSYILTTAALSPTPPLHDEVMGKVLVVLVWILAVAFVSYIKLCISSVFRTVGSNWMFYCGGASQAGSAIGSLVFYFLINYAHVFKSKQACT